MSTAMRWQPGAAQAAIAARSSGLRRMLVILRPYRWAFGLSVAFGIVNAGLGVAAPVLGAYVVARALEGAEANSLWPLVGLLALTVLVRSLANWLEAWTSHELTFRLLAEIRQWLYEAFDRLAPGGLAGRRSGDLVTAAMSDSEALEIFYAHTMINVIVGITVPLLALIAMAAIHPVLASAVLPWLVLTVVVPLWQRRRNGAQGTALRERVATANTVIVDAVQGLKEIVSFGREAERLQLVEDETAAIGHAQRRLGRRSSGELSVAHMLIWCAALSTLLAGAWLFDREAITSSGYVVAVVLALQSFAPVIQMLNNTRITGITNAAARRVFELVAADAPIPDEGAHTTPLPDFEIRFEQVTFRYGPEQPKVLADVSFCVPAGQTVALVGHSGAGKSTCANLLLRFADPEAGRITIGGIDIRDLPQARLRDLISYVPQDTYLFNLPISENLRLGVADATEAAMQSAADAAQASGFIHRMAEGYDTLVGERGARLSGGERQRIAIARALLRDSPILVLDESVSMLDAVSERALQHAVARVREGRTALVIAHRLTTIRSADSVVVLDHGQVADQGSHEALMSRCDKYRDLVRAQWPHLSGVSGSGNESR